MTRDELIAKSGEAYEFQHNLMVVSLEYALQALDGKKIDGVLKQIAEDFPEFGSVLISMDERLSHLEKQHVISAEGAL